MYPIHRLFTWAHSRKDKVGMDRSALLSSVRSALLGSGLMVPVRNGKLLLPALHDVYLFMDNNPAASAESLQKDDGAELRTPFSTDSPPGADVICTLLGSTAVFSSA